jgi:crotonobetainyl-CoA:carnitine CoA-transferase CaiB-like acyl-CoA transferase
VTNPVNKGPLSGIRVIDFGQYLAGPGTAMILADQGADVIRIERPAGPSMRGPTHAVLNRGKRAITLDLKTPEGFAIARDLIAGADVVIENFRPGVMARLGLGSDPLRQEHPGIVYLSLPGFSSADEEFSTLPGWEGVISAATGQFTDMGLNRVLMGIEASYSPLTLASAYASVFGALSVVLALRARHRHGHGDVIEVSLAAALMEALAYNSMVLENMPQRYASLREREISRRRDAGLAMNLTHRQLQSFLDPFYRTYTCRDGRPFYVVSVSHVTHAERALKVLGVWDDLVAAGIPRGDPYLPIRDWPNGIESTIRAHPVVEPWTSRISSRMAEAFLTRDSTEWERLFGEAGAPGAAHRTTQEWLNFFHPREAGLLVELSDPNYGRMIQPGPIAWLVGTPPVPAKPLQILSADRVAALRNESPPQHDHSLVTPEDPVSQKTPWLDGITIIDMTNVIAGPTIAGTLARFGARVIKIDPVSPTFDPWNTIVMGIYSNRGKESVLLDVKAAQGRETFARLIKRADIITINASEKQLGPLGLAFEQLKQLNPRVVLCHLDAFGGPAKGPNSNYPGYDDLVQAATGVMERFGGSLATVEEHAHFGTIDVLGGLSAAFAAGLALLRRESTGTGDVARSSLAAAGQWLQARFMYDFEGRPAFDEPRGREATGEGPYYRCYQASDGWFFLAAREDLATAATARLLGGAAANDSPQLESSLRDLFRTRPTAVWQERLRDLDIAVQPLNSLSVTRARSLVNPKPGQTVHFLREESHPLGSAVEHIDPTAVKPLDAMIVPLSPAPKYGSGTRSVLRELGYTEEEIAGLLATKVIAETWSADYLPN